MSGGVDSSVAAALLREQGYDVIGVMLRLWSEPPPSLMGGAVEQATNRCCSVEAVTDAAAVADRLGIPFYAIDAGAPFKRHVVDAWIDAYASGLTPNPCIACNRHIRFGFLLDFARSLGASHLATGHYARIRVAADGLFELWRGVDGGKDQSYVLSVLGQADLGRVLLPVGEFTKAQVRALAAERGLPSASRADSQDLCFVADGDYRKFLGRHAPEVLRPGPIVDTRGRQVGAHAGLAHYTIGQRSGLGIGGGEPRYVIALDVAHNALIVGTRDELGSTTFRAGSINWIAGSPPADEFDAYVQIRYRAPAVPARVVLQGGRTPAIVQVQAPLRDVTPGQAAVFYLDDRCLGGGLILRGQAEREG